MKPLTVGEEQIKNRQHPYELYEAVQLTEEEVKQAVLQAKIAKYFREKNAAYWAEQEAKKPK